MNKKSKFLSFCFAFIPGAGQMYQGYMKRGISIMAAFCAIITLIATFGGVMFPMLLVVVWFAAFFDSFNVSARTEEERLAQPDDWLWNQIDLGQQKRNINQHRVIGVVCIVLGAWLCLDQMPPFLSSLGVDLGGITWVLRRYIPSIVLALALIWFGFRFIAGPKKQDNSATWQPVMEERQVECDDE